MMIVIATQDYENYAAHQGFDGSFHWKAKGGSEYKITNVPKGIDYEEVVEMVRSEIERNDEYFQTSIIGWLEQRDDYISWFEKSQLDYEGQIIFKEPEIHYRDVAMRYEDPMEYAEMCADNDAMYYGA